MSRLSETSYEYPTLVDLEGHRIIRCRDNLQYIYQRKGLNLCRNLAFCVTEEALQRIVSKDYPEFVIEGWGAT